MQVTAARSRREEAVKVRAVVTGGEDNGGKDETTRGRGGQSGGGERMWRRQMTVQAVTMRTRRRGRGGKIGRGKDGLWRLRAVVTRGCGGGKWPCRQCQ